MGTSTTTPSASNTVTVTAATKNQSELSKILQAIESIALAGLPIFLSLNHNPQTAAEVEAGIEGVGIAAATA